VKGKKMALKVNKKTVLKVDYIDLESFIFEVYGAEYEIAPGEECGNNSNLKFLIGKEEIDTYYRDKLQYWRMGEGEASFLLRTILTDLCNNDKLEAGEYIVNVYW